jgi:alpha-glucosidase
MIETYAELAKIRRGNSALNDGSMRFLYASEEALVFVRENSKQSILVVATRGADNKIVLPRDVVANLAKAENLFGGGKLTLSASTVKLPGEKLSLNIWRLPVKA